MVKMTWEAYEDNGGSLYLVILKDGNPVSIFENWECCSDGELANAVKQLSDNPSAYESWCGNVMDDYDRDELDSVETIKNLYHELTDGSGCNLIADSDGFYEARMGAAGHRAFGV